MADNNFTGAAQHDIAQIEAMLRSAQSDLARIMEALDHLDAGVILYDASDRIVFCNKRAMEFYANVADLFVKGAHYVDILKGFYQRGHFISDAPSEEAYIAERLRVRSSPTPLDYELQMWDDRWLLISDRKTAEGGIIGYRIDITARKKAEQALAESEQRFRSLLNMSTDWYWEQDAAFRFKHISTGMVRSTGVDPNARYGKPRWEIPYLGITREQMAEHRRQVEAHLPFRDFQYAYNLPSGEIWWVSVSGEPVFDEAGKFFGYRGVGANITDKKRTEAQVRELAEFDYLTGLPNRMLLNSRFDFAVRQATRSKDSIALFFIDLDRFKNINDSLGHHIGDMILTESGGRLTRATRSTDTVSRLGGDEFVVMLPGVNNESQIANVADTLLHALSQPHFIEGHELTITPSIGITVWPTDGTSLVALIKNADVAMYHAKGLGRAQYSFFRDEMNARVNLRLSIENALRRAIDRRELSLEYQPIFSLPDKRVIGAEALLRWNSETLGQMPPSQFISIAEDSGLIMPIGEWVVAEACAQLARWRALPSSHLSDFPITINVSGVQWKTPRLLDTLRATLAKHNLTPADIELELTETALVGEGEHTRDLLERVGEAGFRLVIDDFGTGYSNLAYLKRFFITKLKIDQSFVRDITTDAEDAAIVRGIIGLAKSLGLRVVAEGVEYPAQLDFLLDAGCNEAQGYLLAKPMSAKQFEERFQ
jgi:diguanylate cyclase (GGDEF)-like protein/PAS domain S-box-containing protein